MSWQEGVFSAPSDESLPHHCTCAGVRQRGIFSVAVALQAVGAASGLFGALLCGGACQGLEGVAGLGAGGQRGCEPGKDKGQRGVEPAGLGGG